MRRLLFLLFTLVLAAQDPINPPPGASPIHAVGATFSGGGVQATQVFCCIVVPNAGTIIGCTATVKFWKIATGTATPTSTNSINTSGVAISTGTAIHSTTLSDFTTTAVAANDIFAVQLSAVANANVVNVDVQYQ